MTNALSVLNQQLKCELCLKPCCPAMLAEPPWAMPLLHDNVLQRLHHADKVTK